jgi:hypothetical protein
MAAARLASRESSSGRSRPPDGHARPLAHAHRRRHDALFPVGVRTAAVTGTNSSDSEPQEVRMPYGGWVNELPTGFLLRVHIAAFAVGARFAWLALKRGPALLGGALSLFAAEVTVR